MALVFAATADSRGVHALFVDAATADQDLEADVLQPPADLALTVPIAGTNSLTWTVSSSTYASGQTVLRSNTTGGPYSAIATLAADASSYSDSPGIGTKYYVVRATLQNWSSLDSNEVTSAFITLSTAWMPCTSQVADTGGDANGYEVTAGNACLDDNITATDALSGTNNKTSCTNTGKDRHRFGNFNIVVPPAVTTVRGVEVRTQSSLTATGSTNKVCAQISTDGGSTWTTAKLLTLSSTAETVLTLGSQSNLWSRTFTTAQFANGSFVVRIIDVTSSPSTNGFKLDSVQVRVTFS